MRFKPSDAIVEVLGNSTTRFQNPKIRNFECPYIGSRCPKRSTNLKDEPYPVCSIWRREKGEHSNREAISVCPKRFHEVDWLGDVIKYCWPFDIPTSPVIATEVKMSDLGNIDFVIADKDSNGNIENFLSVELQAIDITGSVFPAYQALLNGNDLEKKPTYGFNWDNVYKRFITQLVRKGFFHHHWGTKIVAVMQDHVYQKILDKADFIRIQDVKDRNANIVFMTYTLEPDPLEPFKLTPTLTRVEGTSHSSLQQAIMYRSAPDKDAFKIKIYEALEKQGTV